MKHSAICYVGLFLLLFVSQRGTSHSFNNTNILLSINDSIPQDSIAPQPIDTSPIVPQDTTDTSIPSQDSIPNTDTLPAIQPSADSIIEIQQDSIDNTPNVSNESSDSINKASSIITNNISASEEAPKPRQITPYDSNLVNWVQLDSIQIMALGYEVNRIYSAREMWGDHNLSFSHQVIDPLSKNDQRIRYLSIYILMALMLIVLSKYLFPMRFGEKVKAFYDYKYYNQLEREGGLINDWASGFLYFNFIISMGLLAYHSLEYYNLSLDITHPITIFTMGYFMLIFLVFFVIKGIVVSIISWVFKTYSATESYLRNIVIINYFAGLSLLPLMIIYTYNPISWVLHIAWVVIISINLYKFFRAFSIGINHSRFSVYYIILYLCAIEIAPLLFLIKYSQNILVYSP